MQMIEMSHIEDAKKSQGVRKAARKEQESQIKQKQAEEKKKAEAE